MFCQRESYCHIDSQRMFVWGDSGVCAGHLLVSSWDRNSICTLRLLQYIARIRPRLSGHETNPQTCPVDCGACALVDITPVWLRSNNVQGWTFQILHGNDDDHAQYGDDDAKRQLRQLNRPLHTEVDLNLRKRRRRLHLQGQNVALNHQRRSVVIVVVFEMPNQSNTLPLQKR